MRAHVALHVNDYTVDLANDGIAAIDNSLRTRQPRN